MLREVLRGARGVTQETWKKREFSVSDLRTTLGDRSILSSNHPSVPQCRRPCSRSVGTTWEVPSRSEYSLSETPVGVCPLRRLPVPSPLTWK